MKATVIKRVNTRLEANTSSRKLSPLDVGKTIEVVSVEKGETIDGHSLWITDSNGNKFTAAAFSVVAPENALSSYVDFMKLWNFEGDRPLKIGIYDGGVQQNNELFGNRVIELNPNKQPIIDFHGSYMATIIGGADYKNGFFGFLPNAKLYSYQSVIDPVEGAIIEQQNFLDALRSFLNNDVDVVNISMNTNRHNDFFRTNAALQDLLNEYKTKGIVLVASAGNRGVNDDTKLTYPAKLSEVVSVAGYFFDGPDVTYDMEYNLWSDISILAPSFAIYQNDYYSKFEIGDKKAGTSVSAAVITGMIGAYKLKFMLNANNRIGFKSYIDEQFAAMPTVHYRKQGIRKTEFNYADFLKFKTTLNI